MTDWPNKKAVQLAKHLNKLSKKDQATITSEPVDVLEKYDGVYAFVIVGSDVEEENGVFSRTGKRYTSVDHIRKQLVDALVSKLGKVFPAVAIVELWEKGQPVNYISGRVRKNAPYDECVAVMHDTMPLAEFKAGGCDKPFGHRSRMADVLCENTPFLRPYAYAVDKICGESELIEYSKQAIEQGEGEGVVVRLRSGGWKANKRDINIVKIKCEESFDLEVVGVVNDGKGKYEGLIGGILVKWRLFGMQHGEVQHVKVSGMSDDQRRAWTEHPELIINKIVKVDAMAITQYGQLREPRFKEIREDKLEADL